MKIARLAAFASLRGALLFAALASFAAAQNQTWIRQLGTAELDVASAAAPDGSGGLYVSGVTEGSLGGPNAGLRDAWLAHYDGAGNQTWIRQLGTAELDVANAAAHDGSGGLYVSGVTEGSLGGPNAGLRDAWLAHYDGAGNRTWIRQLGTAESDAAGRTAPDGAGGVYVSGSTEGSLGGSHAGHVDAWLARYDGAGNQIWIQQFGTAESDRAYGAAPDGAGGVYVSGVTLGSLGGPNAGLDDAWLAHYDAAGNQVWIRQFGSTDNDAATAAAPDGSGGVYVSGQTSPIGSLGGANAGGGSGGWLAHYDAAGNQVWMRQLGTDVYDHAPVVAPDGAGGVYVSGDTTGSLGGPNAGGFYDAWLAHYDGVGNQTWIRQFGTIGLDTAYAAAPDGAGGVYVSGDTTGSLGGPNAGGFYDAWLAHYSDLVATRYCSPAIPNSTGQPGVLAATGTNAVPDNNLTLIASQLPANSFGIFITSREQGSTLPVSNSQGRLCLGGFIGRFVGPGQIQDSGSTGSFSLAIDLTATPTTMGFVAVQPGDIWYFQCWHRDANPTSTSNFTDAVSVTFQ